MSVPEPGRPGPRPWRIGAAAYLAEAGSVHRPAFERALQLAFQPARDEAAEQRAAPEAQGLTSLHLLDDGAEAGQARAVAQRFVELQVDVVVGHFSSAAAAAAAPIYARAGIPLLLPAATELGLTRHASCFRVCGHDGMLAQATVADIAAHGGVSRLHIESDGSPHALRMRELLLAALDALPDGGLRHEARLAQADGWYFVGRYDQALRALAERAGRLPGRIFLSDDCVHPDLAGASGRPGPLTLHGFGRLREDPAAPAEEVGLLRRYRQAFGETPGTYFAETFCAMQIALQLGRERRPGEGRAAVLQRLASGRWSSVYGPLHFEQREISAPRFAAWQADAQGLRCLRALPPLPGPQPPSRVPAPPLRPEAMRADNSIARLGV